MIKLQAKASIPTSTGVFDLAAFAERHDEWMPHLAIIAEGALEDAKNKPIPVRLHSECLTGDLLGSRRCECGEQLETALQYINENPGIILYLRQEGRNIGIINKLKAYNLQDKGYNTVEANQHLGLPIDGRTYNDAIAMLNLLGVQKIKLLTNNPIKVNAFTDSNIEVTERVPLEIPPHQENHSYLQTKKDLMGHFLNV